MSPGGGCFNISFRNKKIESQTLFTDFFCFIRKQAKEENNMECSHLNLLKRGYMRNVTIICFQTLRLCQHKREQRNFTRVSLSDPLLNNTRNAKLFLERLDEGKVYLRRYTGLLRNYLMP